MTPIAAHYHRRSFLFPPTIAAVLLSGLTGAAHADVSAAPGLPGEAAARPLFFPAFVLPLDGPLALRQEADDEDDVAFLPLMDAPVPLPARPRTESGTAKEKKKGEEKPAVADAPKPPGEIKVQKFRKLRWSPEGNFFKSEGRVQVIYTDPADNKPAILTAENVDYDSKTGVAKATGGVRLEREEGTFTGQEIQYNFTDRTGYVLDAILETDYFRMRGKRITAEKNGSYTVQDGVFTTCIRGRPDYQIRARKLTVAPNKYVSARGITFYAGGTPLISLPSYKRSLGTGSQAALPRPGYSRSEGLTLRMSDSPITLPHQLLDYDLRLNFRRLPAGYVTYQSDITRNALSGLPPIGQQADFTDPLHGFLAQLSPPTYQEYARNLYNEPYERRTTFFAALENDQFVYNRRRNDLLVSRFPEVGIRFANLLGKNRPAPKPATPDNPNGDLLTRPLNSTDGVLQRIPNAPFLLDLTASLGAVREQPTNLTQGRLAFRANVASQPLLLGRRLSLRLGITDWLNFYSGGTIYNLFSPEAELDYVPTRTSILSVAYRYLQDVGRTPFFFDRRDIRHELRLRYQVGGPWAFGFATTYDLERTRAYDTELAVLRNLDCMQLGVAYRFRSQQFNIIFNLLPPTPDRARRRQPALQEGSAEPSPTAEAALKASALPR